MDHSIVKVVLFVRVKKDQKMNWIQVRNRFDCNIMHRQRWGI